MRINGEPAHVPGIAHVPVPRPSGDLIFTCLSILDYTELETLCPEPTPPIVRHRDGRKVKDYDDKAYQEARGKWSERRQAWSVLTSLKGTDWLSWDTVDMGDPETWMNYLEEFTKAGFAPIEVNRIIDGVYTACGLNQSKIDEAMERFLSGERERAKEESSRVVVANATSASEPVSASA